jgi:pyruvyltransferase
MMFGRNFRLLARQFGLEFGQALPYPHVSLYFWRPEDGSVNFGDFLSLVVVDQVLRQFGRTLHDETPRPARLLALGSILHLATNHNVIWGAGLNGRAGQEDLRKDVRKLDVRAVRGPMTQEIVRRRGIDVPDVFGDPALLVPLLFPNRFKRTSRKPWVFVPNLHDLTIDHRSPPPHTISPLGSWNKRIEAILEADLVLASSLHALVIAEAYGIPARYVRLSESEALFKYRDYYQGTGRCEFKFATNLEQGLEMGGAPPPVFDPQRLVDAFPIDLWQVGSERRSFAGVQLNGALQGRH